MRNWAFIIAALASLAGAIGVGEAAVGAHLSSSPLMQIASNFLMLHATAALAIVAFALHDSAGRTLFLIAATLLIIGLTLFCGDLSVRALLDRSLFPTAAPIGGSLLILGWVTSSLAGLTGLFRNRP